MIVEFNDIRLGFLVDSVERIHRVSADDLDASLSNCAQGPWVLYVMKRDERNILLLDYEAIVQATAPSVAEHMLDEGKLGALHATVGDADDFHILVADDSPLLRQQLKDVLSLAGFSSVMFVRDGMEAYELLLEKNERFHLLITDIEMPRMDGLTLIGEVRKGAETRDLSVILFSSIMVKDLLDRAESLNAKAHILKPDVYKLVECVVSLYQENKEKKAKPEPCLG